MTSLSIEEIKSVLDFLDRNGIFLRSMLEDKLLKE